jgi:hypothetical protein
MRACVRVQYASLLAAEAAEFGAASPSKSHGKSVAEHGAYEPHRLSDVPEVSEATFARPETSARSSGRTSEDGDATSHKEEAEDELPATVREFASLTRSLSTLLNGRIGRLVLNDRIGRARSASDEKNNEGISPSVSRESRAQFGV